MYVEGDFKLRCDSVVGCEYHAEAHSFYVYPTFVLLVQINLWIIIGKEIFKICCVLWCVYKGQVQSGLEALCKIP